MALVDLIDKLLPSWARDGVFQRLMYGNALAMDAILEKLTQDVHAHMPTKADPSALPYIGQDRLIPGGLTESATSYAFRLQHAYDDWKIAGNPWSILRQVLGYLLAYTPAARTVSTLYDTDGTVILTLWNDYAAGDDTEKPPSRTRKDSPDADWDWDSNSATSGSWGRWRWWLVIDSVSPNEWCAEAPCTWGEPGKTWGNWIPSWGLNIPPSVCADIRRIVGLWQKGGAWCRYIMISFDDTRLNPGLGASNPTGSFGRWSNVSGSQYVRSRYSTARYVSGVI